MKPCATLRALCRHVLVVFSQELLPETGPHLNMHFDLRFQSDRDKCALCLEPEHLPYLSPQWLLNLTLCRSYPLDLASQ